MKKVYTTTMINTGGRSGKSHSPNHSFEVKVVKRLELIQKVLVQS